MPPAQYRNWLADRGRCVTQCGDPLCDVTTENIQHTVAAMRAGRSYHEVARSNEHTATVARSHSTLPPLYTEHCKHGKQ